MSQNTIDITVAFLGDPARGFVAGEPSEEYERVDYDELPQATLPAVPNDDYLAIIHRSAQGFGLSALPVDPPFIAFRYEGSTTSRSGWVTELVLVDEYGRATFGHHWMEVTLGAAIDAHEAGALHYDPTATVLVPHYGIGDGIAIDWPQILVAMDYVWSGVRRLAELYGAVQALRYMASRIKDRKDIEERYQSSWQNRGATPGSFHMWVKTPPAWRVSKFSELTGMSEQEVHAYLSGKGFAWDPAERVWRRPLEGEEELLINSLDELVLWVAAVEPDPEDISAGYAQRMVEEFFETGSAPIPQELFARDHGLES